MKPSKILVSVFATGLVLTGCKTVQTASDTLPYPRAQVKEAVINAFNVYDYDVYGVTKTRISADENNQYALFNANASPRVHIDMYKVDDTNTEVRIEFTKQKELIVKTSDESTHSKLMSTIKKYLVNKFGGESSMQTTTTTRDDQWDK